MKILFTYNCVEGSELLQMKVTLFIQHEELLVIGNLLISIAFIQIDSGGYLIDNASSVPLRMT